MVVHALQDPAAINTQHSPPSPFHPSTPSPIPSETKDSGLRTQDLPPLTPHESQLLSSFLILRYDLVALAETNKLHPLQLLAFAMSPAVQAHLAELKKFADQAFALRSLESRNLALDLLEQVAKSSDNPIEKRRAASAILRGLNPVGGTTLRGVRAHSPSQEGNETALRHRRQNFNPSPLPNSPSHPTTVSPSHPPSPTTRPTPNFSHIETAELIGAALKSPTPTNLATLHAFTAPDATLSESKAPTDLEAFIEVARAIVPREPQHKVVIHARKATDTSADILCTLTDAPCNATTVQYDFTLTRTPDRLWLLSSFKRRPEPRGTG
jgi:hypothetical protein